MGLAVAVVNTRVTGCEGWMVTADHDDPHEDQGLSSDMNASMTQLLRTVQVNRADTHSLIVVDRRAFSRACLAQCLAQWLTGPWSDMAALVVADAREALTGATAVAPAAAVLCAAGPLDQDSWLALQVATLRAEYAGLPIALLVETEDLCAVEVVVGRLALHGYIPTTSSMDLVSAAMRVIVAGGTYFPRISDAGAPVTSGPGPAPPQGMATRPRNWVGNGAPLVASPRLTPREAAVLDLLAEGLPNKLIAYQLEMSVSTVKVHVHHLIQKLGARNRTELAVRAPTSRRSAAPGTEAGP